MSDAARLTRQCYLAKPEGLSYTHFSPDKSALKSISEKINEAASDSAYAAVVSYAEALSSLQHGSSSWSVVRLYYSCFYSIRTFLLLNKIVPFNGGKEMLLDLSGGRFLAGGKSSHHWNWTSFDKIARIASSWITSADSKDSYEELRGHRESVNYTHAFTDPNHHKCLITGEGDFGRRFRTYRDDAAFFYTYLADHLAIAYPTKLIFELDASLRSASIELDREKILHVRKIWSIKDRCPMC